MTFIEQARAESNTDNSSGIPAPAPANSAASAAGKLCLFISYSREDADFADQLIAALQLYGFACTIDRKDISVGEDWKHRIGALIVDADTVVFLLSPDSANSPTCIWEVKEAVRLNKRILPVICRPLGDARPPLPLPELTYTYFYPEPGLPGSGFGSGLAQLVAALNRDLEWLREHTWLLQRASEWEAGGRTPNRLLSGDDIAMAKAWAAGRPKTAPEPTTLHLNFLRASEAEAEVRSNAHRRQLEAIGAAQAERERALRQKEAALQQAMEAQHKRVRIRNIALVVVTILAVISWFSGWVALRQTEAAIDILATATDVMGRFEKKFAFDDDAYDQQFRVFQRAAELEIPGAMNSLGWLYASGHGVAQDYLKAHKFYEEAAARMDASAMTNLGALYENGQGVTRDYVKARKLYEKAIFWGDATGMAYLGTIYENGRGVTKDYIRAHDWYEKAAAKDDAAGILYLGMLYENGRGVAEDYAKAREWYERAAAKGDATSMLYLGMLYENGRGVAEDYAKAREWYERAAAKGDATSMLYLGMLYENGRGVAEDYARAHEWYEKAAAKGDARAPIRDAIVAGRHAEALRLQEALTKNVEEAETKREGRPGAETVGGLVELSWQALFAREFDTALAVAERGHAIMPDNLDIEINRAHALMFLGRSNDARPLYLAHKGKLLAYTNKLWERAVADDFQALRKAGVTHSLVPEFETALGIASLD